MATDDEGHVHLVTTDGPMLILGGYTRRSLAERHSRTITGAGVLTLELRDSLPDSVLELLGEEFEDDDTPVEDPTNGACERGVPK